MNSVQNPMALKPENHQSRSMIAEPRDYVEVLRNVLSLLDFAAIEKIAHIIFDAVNREAQVLLVGNGGSASNAAHYRCDLTSTFRYYQRRFQVFNLAESPAILTALGNDFDFAEIFSYQVQENGRPGDVLIMLTASGNSPNILAACKTAQNLDMCTVSITGFDGGKVAQIADCNITIPSDNYGVIEDVQLAVGHMLSQTISGMLKESLIGRDSHADKLPSQTGSLFRP
ncbi:SIS domain-containing protein [Microcoleus sp. N9_B4]|uniref:SIS domain-containing protein n=1 Tax=Microcoleus sp. N9_B4 TaxID=3055386 RepID=UPI002FCFB5A4